MDEDALLEYLDTTGNNANLTLLVRLERVDAEVTIGTLTGPNAWLRPVAPDGDQYIAVAAEAMIGLLGPVARLIAQATTDHDCDVQHPERCAKADDIIAALIEIRETEIGGQRIAARDVLLVPNTLTRPFESQREWGAFEGWRLITEMVAVNNA